MLTVPPETGVFFNKITEIRWESPVDLAVAKHLVDGNLSVSEDTQKIYTEIAIFRRHKDGHAERMEGPIFCSPTDYAEIADSIHTLKASLHEHRWQFLRDDVLLLSIITYYWNSSVNANDILSDEKVPVDPEMNL